MLLKTCQAQWVLGKNNDQWRIVDEQNNLLLELPPQIQDEHVVNTIRRFGMKYEQLGFDEGVEMGKNAMLAANSQRMREMSDQILLLESMNEDLSRNLQRAIGELEED